jgi:hemolysin activation/secretion protein
LVCCVAATGPFVGASMRWRHDTGLDPHRLRSATDLRLEAATGDSTYGRAAMDVSLSTGLPLSLAAALTLSGGTSVGHLPTQRQWLLGGAYTVRGQSPDTAQSGSAYWLTRAEFGIDRSAYRYMLFGDLGWTGDRRMFREVGRPMSGVGLGLSMMDGLVRIDMARGLYPRTQNRVSAYLNARF